MKKRIISVILILCMMTSLVPFSAFAEETPEDDEIVFTDEMLEAIMADMESNEDVPTEPEEEYNPEDAQPDPYEEEIAEDPSSEDVQEDPSGVIPPDETAPEEDEALPGTEEEQDSSAEDPDKELVIAEIIGEGQENENIIRLAPNEQIQLHAMAGGQELVGVSWFVIEALADELSSIAEISGTGMLTAFEEGFARISITFSDEENNYAGTKELIISAEKKEVSLSVLADGKACTALTLNVGDSAQLSALLDGEYCAAEWTLEEIDAESEPAVSITENGLVTALKAGTAIVKMSFAAEDKTYEQTIAVTVLPDESDEFVIDPAVAFPEAPEDAMVEFVTEYDDGYDSFELSYEFVNEMLDLTPYGRSSVNTEAARAYAAYIGKQETLSFSNAAQAAGTATAEAVEENIEELYETAEAVEENSEELYGTAEAIIEDTAAQSAEAELYAYSDEACESLMQAAMDERFAASYAAAAVTTSYVTPSGCAWTGTNGVGTYFLMSPVTAKEVWVNFILYKDNQYYTSRSYDYSNIPGGKLSGARTIDFRKDFEENGNYYFTVQIISRSNPAKASGIGTSDAYKYVSPQKPLGTPGSLKWAEQNNIAYASWSAVKNAGGYEISWESEYGSVGGSWFYDPNRTMSSYPRSENAGRTRYRVRALAADIEVYNNGVYSNNSGYYTISKSNSVNLGLVESDFATLEITDNITLKPIKNRELLIDGVAYTTGDSGSIKVQISGSQTVSIEYAGDTYCKIKYSLKLTGGKVTSVKLTPLAKADKQEVLALILNDSTDVLTEKVNAEGSDNTTEWNFKAYSSILPANIARYELLQDGNIVVTADNTGVFQMVHPSAFSNGSRISIRIIRSNGKVGTAYKTALNVSAYDFNPSLEFSLGGKTTFHFPDSIPIIGGQPFEFSIPVIPVQFEKAEDTWRIGFGVQADSFKELASSKDEWFKFKNLVDDTKTDIEKAKKLRDIVAGLGGLGTMGKFLDPSTKVSIYGYGELKKVTGGWKQAGGKIVIEFSVKCENQWQTVAFSVPVVFGVEVSAKINNTFGLYYDWSANRWSGTGEIKIELPKIKGSGGVGVAKIGNVSIYGSITNNIKWSIEKKYVTDYLSGEIGVQAEALIFSKEWPLASFNGKVIGEKYLSKTAAVSSTASYERDENSYVEPVSMRDILDPSTYVIDRSYLPGQTAWSQTAEYNGAGNDYVNNFKLQTSVYADARPQIVTVGGKGVGVFIGDSGERSTANHSELMYSVLDGEAWSAPRLVHDDNTADFYPSIATDGNELYVVWHNSNKVFDADVTIEEAAAAGEIYLAKFDASTNTFLEPQRLTDNDCMDTNPRVSVINGAPEVIWQRNENNDILAQTGTNSVMYWNGASEETVWTGANPVLDVAVAGGTKYYVLDSDGDLMTFGNTLYSNGSACGTDVYSLQTAMVGGENTVFWSSDDSVYMNGTDTGLHAPAIFTAVGNEYGEYAIIFPTVGNVENIEGTQIGLILSRYGTDGKTIVLTETEGYKENFSAVMTDSGIDIVYTSTEAEIKETGVFTNTSLQYCSMTYFTDLEVLDASISQSDVAPGATVPVYLEVMNKGTEPIYSLNVNCSGEVYHNAYISTYIPVGETAEISFDLPLYGDIRRGSVNVEVYPGASDANMDDNTAELQIGYTDIEVNAEAIDSLDGTGIIVTVSNISCIPTSAEIQIRSEEDIGPVVDRIRVENIEPYTTQALLIDATAVEGYDSDAVWITAVADDEEYYTGNNQFCLPINIWESTAGNGVNPISLSMSMMQLDLEEGQSCKLDAFINDEPAEDGKVSWWIENEDGEVATAASVDSSGVVTALHEGSVYAVASVNYADVNYTARCRIDIYNNKPENEVTNVTILQDKLDVNIFSEDYAEFDVLMISALVAGNSYMSSGSASATMENNGFAVKSASFEKPELNELFRLRVKDDRTIQIIPIADVANSAEAAKYASAYSSRVILNIGSSGKAMTTTGELKISVKKTLPKITAAKVSINKFYSDLVYDLKFTGGEVTRLTAVSVPDWITLDGDKLTITLNENTPKSSATLKLKATVKGYAAPCDVSVSVAVSSVKPALKLSSTSVTFADVIPNEDFAGASLSLQPKTKGVTFESLNVASLTVQEPGYEISQYSMSTGEFKIKPVGKPKGGTIHLLADVQGSTEPIILNLTVKAAKVSITPSAVSAALNTAVTDKVWIDLKFAPADYIPNVDDLKFEITNAKKALCPDELNVKISGSKLYISNNQNTVPGTTYKVKVIDTSTGIESKVVSVKANAPQLITVTAAASGKANLITGVPATVKLTVKNYNLTEADTVNFKVYSYTSTGKLVDEVTDAFVFTRKTAKEYSISAVPSAGLDKTLKYKLTASLFLNGSEYASKQVALATAYDMPKLKLGKTSLTLNPSVKDEAVISLTSATAGFTLTSPIIEVTDNYGWYADYDLDVSYKNNQITIRTIPGQTSYGRTYYILCRSMPDAAPVKLTVKTTTMASSTVKMTLKASGAIDVLRRDSAVKLTPKFTNCISGNNFELACRVYENGFDVTEKFTVTVDSEQTITIKALRGAQINHKSKYTVKVYANENEVMVCNASANLSVKQGTAKITQSVKSLNMFQKDKFCQAQFSLGYDGDDLSGIARVELVDASGLFKLYDLGSGTYSIGYSQQKSVPVGTKSVKLQVFMEGNETTTPNATVSISIKIV